MELERIDCRGFNDGVHKFHGWIHKDADPGNERRQLADDLRGLAALDIAFALIEEHEAQRIRSRIDCGNGILHAGDPANFHSHWHSAAKLNHDDRKARVFWGFPRRSEGGEVGMQRRSEKNRTG